MDFSFILIVEDVWTLPCILKDLCSRPNCNLPDQYLQEERDKLVLLKWDSLQQCLLDLYTPHILCLKILAGLCISVFNLFIFEH